MRDNLNDLGEETMVSVIILFEDTSLLETKTLLASTKYHIRPDGTLMSPPNIPPAEMIVKHLTGTFNQNNIVLSFNNLMANTSEDFINKNIISLNKTIGVTITPEDISTWKNSGDNIYFALDGDENVYGYIRFKYYNKMSYPIEVKKYAMLLESEYFIVISDLIVNKKEIDFSLLHTMHTKYYTEIDSILNTVNEIDTSTTNRLGYKLVKNTLVRISSEN